MNVAFILPSLINQGPVVVAYNLVNRLIELGCLVDVYYFDENKVLPFRCDLFKISLNQKIEFNKYDIIHSHCFRPDMYVYRWKESITRAKTVTTLHQDTYKTSSYEYNNFISYFYTKWWYYVQSTFDSVVAISNQIRDIYNNSWKNKAITIYNGCQTCDSFPVDSNIANAILLLKKKGFKIIGNYAYVTKRKGLSQIIYALAELKDFAFIIVGEGPDIDYLKSLSRKLGIDDRVLFFPYQRYPIGYLSFFDVYAMPSYSEGFGLAMVEAALNKKSIVCSDIPSFHEIFPSGESSFFELNDIDSLCKAILNAYDNREHLGSSAYNRAIEQFTVQKMGDHYYSHYMDLLNK